MARWGRRQRRRMKRSDTRENMYLKGEISYQQLTREQQDNLVLIKWRKLNPQADYFIDALPVRYE